MKVYMFVLLLLAIIFWGNWLALLWISAIAMFIPLKYAKDFLDKRLK